VYPNSGIDPGHTRLLDEARGHLRSDDVDGRLTIRRVDVRIALEARRA